MTRCFLLKVGGILTLGILPQIFTNNLESSWKSIYKHIGGISESLERFQALTAQLNPSSWAQGFLLKIGRFRTLRIDNQHCVILLLLDMYAAFDAVDHELLLSGLSSPFGVKGNALRWFRSYLKDRRQFVCVDGANTNTQPHTNRFPNDRGMKLMSVTVPINAVSKFSVLYTF